MTDTQVLRPDDAEYDKSRRVWNAMVDRPPALIARCRETRDVLARYWVRSMRPGADHRAGLPGDRRRVGDGLLT